MNNFHIFKNNKSLDLVAKIVIATMLLAFLAPIDIGISALNVPITLQSLLIIMLPMLIGANAGVSAVCLYLLLGIIGLPVFANYSSGIEKFTGPTAGFLISFPIAAYVVGYWSERISTPAWGRIFVVIIFANTLIQTFGLFGLSTVYDLEGLLSITIKLTPGMLIKTLIGTSIVYWFRKKHDLNPT